MRITLSVEAISIPTELLGKIAVLRLHLGRNPPDSSFFMPWPRLKSIKKLASNSLVIGRYDGRRSFALRHLVRIKEGLTCSTPTPLLTLLTETSHFVVELRVVEHRASCLLPPGSPGRHAKYVGRGSEFWRSFCVSSDYKHRHCGVTTLQQ